MPADFPNWANPLPFFYLSTGADTLFHDASDSLRRFLVAHRPERLRACLQAAGGSLRALGALSPIDLSGLRDCQADAVRGVEAVCPLPPSSMRSTAWFLNSAVKRYHVRFCAIPHNRLLYPELPCYDLSIAGVTSMPDRPEQALTVRDVAGYLNVDEKTVYRLAKRGGLPGFRVAGAWRFKRSDLDCWIDRQKQAAQHIDQGRK